MNRYQNIAIIILNYMSYKETIRTADMMADRYGFGPDQIIVVDNASPNESAEELKAAAEGRFVFIPNDTNSGYAAGNNIGLRYARENGFEYAIVMNNDIFCEEDNLIDEISSVFKKDESVAVVSTDVYGPDGHLFNRDSVRPSFYDYTFGMLGYRKKGRQLNELDGYSYIYRPNGCFMMCDLKKLEEINYMDEHTFLYFEESILSERLSLAGYKCALAMNARVIHENSKTVLSVLKYRKIRKIQAKSLNYLLREYRGFGKPKRMMCVAFHTLKLIMMGQ